MLEKEFLSDEPSEVLEEEFIDNNDLTEDAAATVETIEEEETNIE